MITTAIILAGGFGTRLQSVVADVPKPMAPVNGEPFLNYQLHYLKHYGITDVILSVGYMHEKISTYYNNAFNGIRISCVVETTPLGTGGGIRKALENCSVNEVLVLNGDSFFDVNLTDFHTFYKSHNAQFSLCLREVDNAARYGTIELDNSKRIVSFKEKDQIEKKGIINGGLYILNKALFLENTPAKTNLSIEKDIYEKELLSYKICVIESKRYIIDKGVPEDYTKAQHDFKGFTYR